MQGRWKPWALCGVLLAAGPLLWPAPAQAQAQAAGHAHANPVDRLGVAGPQQVGGQAHTLVFVTPPQPSGYVLQEYLPAGQALDSYTRMLLLAYQPSDETPLQWAQAKQAEINARRDSGSDAVASTDLYQAEQGDAAVLVFTLSATLPDGRFVLEWNVYHYQRQAGGMVLTALSRRGYGREQAVALLEELKTGASAQIKSVVDWQPRVVAPRAR